MPAGALVLAGTQPTCTTVTDGRRVPLRARQGRTAAGGLRTARAPSSQTVDKTKHVNGGCRSLTLGRAREWECYIGQAAVDQQIISKGFLGQVETAPGVG